MTLLSSSKVANSKASASCEESWRLKASKLREKAGGVGDRGIASKSKKGYNIYVREGQEDLLIVVIMLLYAKAPEGSGHGEQSLAACSHKSWLRPIASLGSLEAA